MVGSSLLQFWVAIPYSADVSTSTIAPTLRFLAFAGAIAFGCAALGAAATANLPAAATPGGLHALDGARGGRIVMGSLSGVTSPDAAFLLGLQRMHGYFDRAHLAGAVRSVDGTTTLGQFSADLRGTPVDGIVVTSYAPGASRLAVLYDRKGRLGDSLRPMLAQLSRSGVASTSSNGAASDGAPVPPLHEVDAQDGTVSARIPAQWSAARLSEGVFAATAPDGSEVDQELSASFLDPRSPMASRPSWPLLPYPASPAQGLIEATHVMRPDPQVHIESSTPQGSQGNMTVSRVEGTQTLRNGTPGRFRGFIALSSLGQYGLWTISIKSVAAPSASFVQQLPTLVAIFSSYHVNQGARNAQVGAYLAEAQQNEARLLSANAAVQRRNAAVASASEANARNVQDGIDRSTSGFVHYLAGTTVVQDAATGGSATVDQSFGSNLVRSNPGAFRELPVSEYRKGIDF
jgi:hypothetical protein